MSLKKIKKEVMRLNPVDHRFTPLKVDRELEEVIYCKKHAGTKPIAFKVGPGWTSDSGGEVRFLTVEGNPLVSWIEGKDVKVESVEKYLKLVWGDKAYLNMPETLRKALTDRSVGVAVTVMPMIPDFDLKAAFNEVKAESILYEADLQQTSEIGTSKEVKKNLDKVMEKIPWLLGGMGLTYVLMGLGVLKGF